MVVASSGGGILADVVHADEASAEALADVGLLGVELGSVVVALGEEDEGLAVGVEVADEGLEGLGVGAGGGGRHRAGVVFLGHVGAIEENDHVGTEGARPGEQLGAVPVGIEERALKRARDLQQAALRLGLHGDDLRLQTMDVVLVPRGGGHAPVARPADALARAMKRDGVADEEDARPLLRLAVRLDVGGVLPQRRHGVRLRVRGQAAHGRQQPQCQHSTE